MTPLSDREFIKKKEAKLVDKKLPNNCCFLNKQITFEYKP